MRRIIAWCVPGLPFESRSRRAIDETLADWAHEEQEAPTWGRRTLAGVQGILSIVRVVSISVIRENVDSGWCRGLARRWAFVAAVVMLLALATAAPMIDALGARTLTLAVLGVPLVLLAVLPPAIFLMFAWRPVSRAVPTAGTACFLASRCSRTRSEHRSWCSNPPEIRLSDSGRASRRGRRLGFS